MVISPDYKISGLLSKFMQLSKSKISGSIVTFSDNRLFTGNVYNHMGFSWDGDVRQDYYWVKQNKRFHKSTLRKPPGEVKTEKEIREAEGYRQIWDLGKKRFVIKSF